METTMSVEEMRRAVAAADEKLHQQRNQRQSATVIFSSRTDHLNGTLLPLRDDMAKWIAALEDIEPVLVARLDTLEATAKAGPETVQESHDDPMGVYGQRTANRQKHDRLVRDELPELRRNLDALRKGPMRHSDIPEMLLERGIHPLPGFDAVYRGPGRVPLLRARSAFEALLREIERVTSERDAAKATLDALDAASS